MNHQEGGGRGLSVVWNKRNFGVQGREWQEHGRDVQLLAREGDRLAFQKGLGKSRGEREKGEGQAEGLERARHLWGTVRSQSGAGVSFKMSRGGNDWKDRLRWSYGRDNEWGGIKEKVKEIEQKWMGPVEGSSRAEITTESNRGIREGWEEIMKNGIWGKGIWILFLYC